jgi:hypothetical protein
VISKIEKREITAKASDEIKDGILTLKNDEIEKGNGSCCA